MLEIRWSVDKSKKTGVVLKRTGHSIDRSQGYVATAVFVVGGGPGDADVYGGAVRQYAGDGHPAAAVAVVVRAAAARRRDVGRMLFEPERALLEDEDGHDGRDYHGSGDVHERQVHEAGHVQRPVAPHVRLIQRRRLRVRPVHGQYPIIAEREPTGQERREHDGRNARAHRRHHILAAAHVRAPALVVPQ